MTDKKSSHLGAGLLAGAILGVAAGLFLQSKKGKDMTKDLMKRAEKLRAKLLKELAQVTDLTREKYEEVVDTVVEYYVKSKEIAKTEIPEIRKFLLMQWSQIEKTMKSRR